jgi:tRNA pseudouridine synthase 10
MGREDIDARMLGRGRPFVLELVRPARRSLDLAALAKEIERTVGDRVRVVDLAGADAGEVLRVKEAAPEKSYRVGIRCDVPEAKVKEALSLLAGQEIAQRTPTRVAHRRSDRVRPRRIVAAELVAATDGVYTIDLRTESGTYVKEWVEGDGGRTQPNLSQALGVPCRVEFLDVLEIHDEESVD